MHPDQSTPDSHRHATSDSHSTARRPEQDQGDASAEGDESSPSAEVPDGARVAEAGNAYVGRELDDALKSSPRVEDGDEAVDEDPTTPGDD